VASQGHEVDSAATHRQLIQQFFFSDDALAGRPDRSGRDPVSWKMHELTCAEQDPDRGVPCLSA
jgi:hypothetical protein